MTFKELLKNRGYNQKSLVNRLSANYGLYKYQQQISDWITGVRLPDIESVYYMSKILKVSCGELIEMFIGERNARFGYSLQKR